MPAAARSDKGKNMMKKNKADTHKQVPDYMLNFLPEEISPNGAWQGILACALREEQQPDRCGFQLSRYFMTRTTANMVAFWG